MLKRHSPETAPSAPRAGCRRLHRALGAALELCEVIKEGRNGYTRHLLFLVKVGERHAWRRWKVAIKATEDGEELFLVTLHPLQPGDYQNISPPADDPPPRCIRTAPHPQPTPPTVLCLHEPVCIERTPPPTPPRTPRLRRIRGRPKRRFAAARRPPPAARGSYPSLPARRPPARATSACLCCQHRALPPSGRPTPGGTPGALSAASRHVTAHRILTPPRYRRPSRHCPRGYS